MGVKSGSQFRLEADLLVIRKGSSITVPEIEVISGTKITLEEQLPASDDVLGGEKCAVKRWRVSVVELSTAETEAKRNALAVAEKAKVEADAKAKKEEAEKAAKIAAEAAKSQPPPPPKA